MILTMTKIRIMGPKGLLPGVTDLLHGLGEIHVESRPPDAEKLDEILLRRFSLEASALHTRETLERLLQQVKKALLLLPAPAMEAGAPPIIPPAGIAAPFLKEAGSKIDALVSRLDQLAGKKKVYTDELSLLERYEKTLQALAPLISQVRESRDLDYLGVTLRIKAREVIPILDESMAKLTGNQYEILYAPVDAENLAALLVFPKECYPRVKSLLWEEAIGELRLPASIMDKSLGEAFKIILRKRRALPLRIKAVDRELAQLAARWHESLTALRAWLENRMNQILIAASFYETKMTFVIYGWLPMKRFETVRRRLIAGFEGRVVMDTVPIEAKERDQIPVSLSNLPFIRPFERFTKILPLPRYGTVDPTPFIAVFFPLFFGMIVGDIGYGLLLLIAAAVVRRRFRESSLIRDGAFIFTAASMSSIAWGVLFGEFFGDLGERFGLHPILMNRMEGFLENLLLSLAFGAVHLLLGIGLGLYTAFRRGHSREIVVKGAGLLLMMGFLTLTAGLVGLIPRAFIPAGLLAVIIVIPVMGLIGGAAAAMEVHNLINLLSYLRLMGIGVASVALAFAANRLGELAGNIVLGILIGGLLHAVNLVFAVFSPTIQSLRLHYVEFFENFFQAGGREYKPFKKNLLERSA